MFFVNSTQEVTNIVNMCASLFFEDKEVTKKAEQSDYNIRQFYQRNEFLGFYSEYILKLVDCSNAIKHEKFDDDDDIRYRIQEDRDLYLDKCQNFISDQDDYKEGTMYEFDSMALIRKNITAVLMYGVDNYDCSQDLMSKFLCFIKDELLGGNKNLP